MLDFNKDNIEYEVTDNFHDGTSLKGTVFTTYNKLNDLFGKVLSMFRMNK